MVSYFYNNEESLLSNTLKRHADFFKLFSDFRGYVDFFLLQDLVTISGREVRISRPFDNFHGSPVPGNPEEYRAYRDDAVAFIDARVRGAERAQVKPK